MMAVFHDLEVLAVSSELPHFLGACHTGSADGMNLRNASVH
jgi:hypothetical protein